MIVWSALRGTPFNIGGSMEGEVLQLLMSGGANVAFAVFLYTQNKDLLDRDWETHDGNLVS